MLVEIAAPLHFAAEFLVLAVCVGAAFRALGRDGPGGAAAYLEAAGFLGLAVAQALHGARILDADAARGLAAIRTVSFGLVALGARPKAATAAPAFLLGGKAPVWSVAPAALAAMVAARGAAAHRKDQDPATFAFTAAFAAFAGAEIATVLGGDAGGSWLAAAHGLRAAAALLLARWLWSAIVGSIRLRFLAAFLAALLVLVLVISASVTQVVGNNVRDEELGRVTTAATSEVAALTPLRQRALTGAATLAQLRGISEDMAAGRRPQLQATAHSTLRALFPDVDFVVLVDARGRTLASAASTPGNRGVVVAMPQVQSGAIAGSDLVASVLSRAGRGETIDTAGPQTVVVVAASVVTRGSATIGAVALGYRIDADFLAPIARRSGDGAIVSVMHGGEVVATTGAADAASASLARGSTGSEVRRRVVERGTTFATAHSVGGERYFSAFAPLKRTIDGQPVGVMALSHPASSANVTQRGINQILFAVTLIAAAIAALIAWLVGGRITRPLRRLTDAAERVRRGDLDARADVNATDEVGALGSAFNEMTGSLVQLTDDLREAADEEAALRTQLEAIMQSMGDGLIATDDRGRIVAFNRAAERIVGRESRRALGKTLGEVLRNADGGAGVEELAMSGGGEALIGREKGGSVPVALTSAPLKDATGNPGGRVIVFRDISREAEAERMKTEFLSNVSHELRTPLTPIKGYTEILKRKQFPRQKAIGFLDGILESTTRLERIVEILVDFAAMEAGRLQARTEPVDVRAFSTSLLSRWKGRSAGHSFSLQVPTGLPKVEADPRLLSKCVDELIDNAVKFSPARNGRRPRVVVDARVSRAKGRHRVRLSVKDHGIGIKPEEMSGIFQDFRQLDGSDTRPYGGLGLGLAYAKRVVEVHRGSIEVESTPGRGSTFSLLLPVAETRKGRGSARRAPARPATKAPPKKRRAATKKGTRR